jgi:hypothetical protein
MRESSADSSGAVLALVLEPLGRPTLRLIVDWVARERVAAFSSAVRTTCSTAIGKERRCLMEMRLSAKKASPGSGLP